MTTESRKKDRIRVQSHLKNGLHLLLQAFEYAEDLGRDQWDFAVELPCLRRAGMSNSDLRYLVFQGFAEHGREVSLPGDRGREFRRDGNLVVSRKTCFVLTESGVKYAKKTCGCESPGLDVSESVRAEVAAEVASSPEPEINNKGTSHMLVPTWDPDRQELRWGDVLVKQFKLPSPNQATVLMAFEEDKWPPRIDDPLPPQPEIEPKRRLNDTIKSLNRNQKHRVIRFMGDGSGLGIRWEPIDDVGSSPK